MEYLKKKSLKTVLFHCKNNDIKIMTRLFLFILLLELHPFHVSVCEIVYQEKDKRLELSQRVFLDDFQDGLQHYYEKKIDLHSPYDTLFVDSLIENYVRTYLALEIKEERLSFKYLGHETEKSALWYYIEVTEVKDFTRIFIQNTILLDQFDDQSNLIHFKKNDEVKSQRINADKTVASFVFKK